MPRGGACSTGASRVRSRRCTGTTMPSAATTIGPGAPSTVTGTATEAAPSDISSAVRARPRRGAPRHLLPGAGPAPAAHLGQPPGQPPRVCDGVPGLPRELAQPLVDDVV